MPPKTNRPASLADRLFDALDRLFALRVKPQPVPVPARVRQQAPIRGR